jgi:probable FeS assembly SUF system protein SufT
MSPERKPKLNPGDSVPLARDVEAVIVPEGQPVTLLAGESATLTQALGSSYTVIVRGNMFRIDGRNADALGFEVESVAKDASYTGPVSEDLIWDALRNCYDPEIPVNLVDLGLIYDCVIDPLPDGGNKVSIKMTLTAPGCGMGSTIARDVQNRVLEVPGVTDAEVDLVWDPPWHQDMMSEAARLQLGLL